MAFYRNRGSNPNLLCGKEIRASTCLHTDFIKSLTGTIDINASGGLRVNGVKVSSGSSELVAEIFNTNALSIPGESSGVSLPIEGGKRLTGNIGMSYEKNKGIWLDELGIYELKSILQFGKSEHVGVLESYFDYSGNLYRKYGYDIQQLNENHSGVLKNSCLFEHTCVDDYISLKLSNSSTESVELNTDELIGWSWTIKYVGKLKNNETNVNST